MSSALFSALPFSLFSPSCRPVPPLGNAPLSPPDQSSRRLPSALFLSVNAARAFVPADPCKGNRAEKTRLFCHVSVSPGPQTPFSAALNGAVPFFRRDLHRFPFAFPAFQGFVFPCVAFLRSGRWNFVLPCFLSGSPLQEVPVPAQLNSRKDCSGRLAKHLPPA